MQHGLFQIPDVVYTLTSLTHLFLRFNRIRVVDDEIRYLKVCVLPFCLLGYCPSNTTRFLPETASKLTYSTKYVWVTATSAISMFYVVLFENTKIKI